MNTIKTQVVKTLKPGQTGTSRFTRKYGAQLVAVRYRRKPLDNKTYTTVEIIVDEREYAGKNISLKSVHSYQRKQWVAVPIAFDELELRYQAKQMGAQWSKKYKVWVLLYHQAVEMGIIHRQRPDVLELIDDIEIHGQI